MVPTRRAPSGRGQWTPVEFFPSPPSLPPSFPCPMSCQLSFYGGLRWARVGGSLLKCCVYLSSHLASRPSIHAHTHPQVCGWDKLDVFYYWGTDSFKLCSNTYYLVRNLILFSIYHRFEGFSKPLIHQHNITDYKNYKFWSRRGVGEWLIPLRKNCHFLNS